MLQKTEHELKRLKQDDVEQETKIVQILEFELTTKDALIVDLKTENKRLSKEVCVLNKCCPNIGIAILIQCRKGDCK